jgi:hypothetical protein
MLANIGELINKGETELLVAVSPDNRIAGGVVYFSDMQYYGSGGTRKKKMRISITGRRSFDPGKRDWKVFGERVHQKPSKKSRPGDYSQHQGDANGMEDV